MRNTTVLVSGASVAGPTLAYWLGRYGFRPTVVEIAPSLRDGGNAVDFRGESHLTVLERMGLLDDLRALQTGGTAMRFVDAHGRRLMELPPDFAGGDLEVLRGELSLLLYEHSRERAEYVFGDSVTALENTAEGVRATFASGATRTFDLVVGADGVHSQIRRLTFGPEADFVRHLGYYLATWSVPGDFDLGRNTLLHNAPGLMASLGGNHRDPHRALAFVMFASPPLDYDRHDLDQQRTILRERFAGLRWEVPRLLAALPDATDLYFDAICRVDATTWSRGRVTLLGDAAAGATLGGMGTGTAVLGAYVLAGELAVAGGDHTVAYPRYEALLGGLARRCQKGGNGAGKFHAPRRNWTAWARNALLNQKWAMDMTLRVARERTESIALPDYPALLAGAGTDSIERPR